MRYNRLMFKQMIRELCAELSISYTELSDHWIFRLEKDGKVHFISGNRFDLNSAASADLADDKVSAYEVMHHAGISAVPHRLVLSRDPKSKALSLLKSQNYPIVIKPNRGAGGRNVFLCETPLVGKKNLQKVLRSDRAVAICPFIDAPYEYRCFFLDGKILLIYQKIRTNSWQHNLSHGAKPVIVPQSSATYSKLSKLASAAGNALGLRFATVDILEDTRGKFHVIELNQGVSTTIFSQSSPENYELAKNIYRRALKALFVL